MVLVVHLVDIFGQAIVLGVVLDGQVQIMGVKLLNGLSKLLELGLTVLGVSAYGEETLIDMLAHAEALRVLAFDTVFHRFKATIRRCTTNGAGVTSGFQNVVFSDF